jgi:ribosomal protein S14
MNVKTTVSPALSKAGTRTSTGDIRVLDAERFNHSSGILARESQNRPANESKIRGDEDKGVLSYVYECRVCFRKTGASPCRISFPLGGKFRSPETCPMIGVTEKADWKFKPPRRVK